jgi:hypothetical protein
MASSELPESLLRFIASNIPTYQSAEVLLFLAARRERRWKPDEIVAAIQPFVITAPAVRDYLALFQNRGLVEESDGTYRYHPSSPGLETEMEILARAYRERPVTLIHTIYRIAENRIQSFADSFKFRKE